MAHRGRAGVKRGIYRVERGDDRDFRLRGRSCRLPWRRDVQGLCRPGCGETELLRECRHALRQAIGEPHEVEFLQIGTGLGEQIPAALQFRRISWAIALAWKLLVIMRTWGSLTSTNSLSDNRCAA